MVINLCNAGWSHQWICSDLEELFISNHKIVPYQWRLMLGAASEGYRSLSLFCADNNVFSTASFDFIDQIDIIKKIQNAKSNKICKFI